MKYKVALYCRLSKEDGDKVDSDSIINQKDMLSRFIKDKEEFDFFDYYIDDGFTGTNFNRPSFLKMIDDIKNNQVNCVIVKDLSRFGRDYIMAGYYIDVFFKERCTRFIAINDGTDTANASQNDDLLLPIKNIFNANYSKDISKKVKSAFKTKQLNGEFVGAFPSYGYLKNPNNKNKLIVDEYASNVVKRIFEMYKTGIGKIRIAKILNEENILCPTEYKIVSGMKYHNGQRINNMTYWTYSTIHRILQNEMYIGNTVQNKTIRNTIHGKAKQLDKEEWIIVEGTHDAIIDTNTWITVQNLMSKNRTRQSSDFKENISPIAGFITCGDCGRSMSKTKINGIIYYTCSSYKRYGKTVCSRHCVEYKEIENEILNYLNDYVGKYNGLKDLEEQEVKKRNVIKSNSNEINKINAAIDRLNRLKIEAYDDYKEGLISKDDFINIKNNYDKQLNIQNDKLSLAKKSIDIANIKINPFVKRLVELGRVETISREIVSFAVKYIKIYLDKNTQEIIIDIKYLI